MRDSVNVPLPKEQSSRPPVASRGQETPLNEPNVAFPGERVSSVRARGNRYTSFDSVWTAKRVYDLFFSFCGLLFLSPLLVMIGALVKLADRGDIFYRQVRVGRHGRHFLLYKFRTMIAAADQAGPSVTKNGDSRITWIGRILRKTKLDELPQLWNVLKGEMSLVGPRPEVPRYVRQYTPEQRTVLRYKPGITDLASLCFRNEESLLANADDLEEFYLQHCVPRKLQLNRAYAKRANLLSDTWIILQTVCPYWLGVLVCYSLILAVSFWLSCQLIYSTRPPGLSSLLWWRGLAATLALQLVCLTWRRQCKGLLSYFSLPELLQTGVALGLAGAGLLVWSISGNGHPAPNVVLVNTLLSLCLLGGFRFLLRWGRERFEAASDESSAPPARVGIIGTSRTGAQLALELMSNPKCGRTVVAFFDDDAHKWQKRIHDVPVAGMPECLLDGWADKLDEVVIALPDAPADRLRQIQSLLGKTHLKHYTVSSPARFWERPQAA